MKCTHCESEADEGYALCNWCAADDPEKQRRYHFSLPASARANALLDMHHGACSVHKTSPILAAFRDLESIGEVEISQGSLTDMYNIKRKDKSE